MLLVYVAGRYLGPDQETIDANIEAARYAGRLIAELGHFPVIPHVITVGFNSVQSHQFWLAATMKLMEVCDCVYLCPGWRQSEGSIAERSRAKALQMPVYERVEDIFNG